jgi:hypothetical protein
MFSVLLGNFGNVPTPMKLLFSVLVAVLRIFERVFLVE